jgi:hypothetical protein
MSDYAERFLFSWLDYQPPVINSIFSNIRPVRLAYQPPASGTFLSEQISHQQPANSTFFQNKPAPATSQPNRLIESARTTSYQPK